MNPFQPFKKNRRARETKPAVAEALMAEAGLRDKVR